MKCIDAKKTAVHISLCAGIIGIAGVFFWFRMGYLVYPVLLTAGALLLLNLFFRCIGKLAARRFAVSKQTANVCAVLLAAFTFLAAVCGFLYTVQDRMFFYNVNAPASREFLRDKAGYREIEITGKNGKTYHGMMYQAAAGNAPLVIYFGGNGECSYSHFRHREEQGLWSAFLPGYNYLYIDYEGYGINGGRTNYLKIYEQALEVYDYAVTELPGVDSDRIVTMGYSLGTGSAVFLAANRPVSGLILQAPYAKGMDLYNNLLPVFYGPVKMLAKQKLPSDEYAAKVICPVLIIASHSDETVPFSSSERLSKLFPGRIDFLRLDNVSHNGVYNAPGVYERLRQFLREAAQ